MDFSTQVEPNYKAGLTDGDFDDRWSWNPFYHLAFALENEQSVINEPPAALESVVQITNNVRGIVYTIALAGLAIYAYNKFVK